MCGLWNEKAPFEHQMGDAPQALVFLSPRKSEVPGVLLFTVENAMEKIALTVPSVPELQEAVVSVPKMLFIPAEATMNDATETAVGTILPLRYY